MKKTPAAMILMMSDRLSLREPPAAMMLPAVMRRGQGRSALSKFMRFQASGNTIPQAAENRKGETWQTVLKQYPNLEFVVSDQASGLRKGVNACGREITHQYDLLHFSKASWP